MAIPTTRKYQCSKCDNSFVRRESYVIITDMICKECGNKLNAVDMSVKDYINPLERIKSIKHTIKGLNS